MLIVYLLIKTASADREIFQRGRVEEENFTKNVC